MEIELQHQLFSTPQSGQTSDDYYTPKWLFEEMGLRFDIDVAAPPGGVPWIPADRFYTQADNGLTSPWYGRLWMNPPFSKPTPWVRRFRDHNNGVALLPTSKASWYEDLWQDPNARFVSIPSKFEFTTPAGDGKGIFMPTVLVAFGEENQEAIRFLGRLR
jgi:hypothetical protein